jgi:sugar lactone lactonase YvrE
MGDDGARRRLPIAAAACCAAVIAGGAAVPGAQAFSPRNGAAATVFAGGFDPLPGRGIGPVGLAFDGSRRLYVSALEHVYRFGPAGGRADDARLSRDPVGRVATGLAFGSDGRLYAARYTREHLGDVVELDPADGSVRRIVAPAVPCPTALATDPLSGDLLVSTVACGKSILRVSDPAGAAPRTTVFLTGLSVDGLTFAPDGTLYVAHDPDGSGATVSTVTPGGQRRALISVPHADGVALGVPDQPGDAPPFVVVNRTDGVITKVDLRLPGRPRTNVVVDGSRGDLIAVGPDRCLYATQSDSVLRVSDADGTCGDGSGPLEQGLLPTVVMPRPRPRGCPARRSIRVSLRFGHARLRVARVYLGARRVRIVRGRALRRPVRLRHLPARRFTVTVRATTRRGGRRKRSTTYSACGRRVVGRRQARAR